MGTPAFPSAAFPFASLTHHQQQHGAASPSSMSTLTESASDTSPAILSPNSESDKIFGGSDSLLQNTTLETAPDALPPAQRPGAIPLASPSDDLDADSNVYQSRHEFNIAFASAIPTDISPPITPLMSDPPFMRLPSFDMLGIGFPHPDRNSTKLTRLPLRRFNATRALQEDYSVAGGSSTGLLPDHLNRPFEYDQFENPSLSHHDRCLAHQPPDSVLTPPEDQNPLEWALPRNGEPCVGDFATLPRSGGTPHRVRFAGSGDQQPTTMAPGEAGGADLSTSQEWLETAVNAINFSTGPPGNVLKVLSHALPTPTIPGHAFPAIINAIRNRLPSPLVWINLLHAVPKNLSEVPTSPISTPGVPLTGEDYFTTKIFDSATRAVDYEKTTSPSEIGPYSLAPPSSVNVSIVERYIPPASSKEFAELFSPARSSILIDRMVELTPNDGVLLFIYPTRQGATTFMNEYLGPLIDPLLRSIVVVNGLSADLSTSIGTMEAKDKLHTYEDMKRKMTRICHTMSSASPEVLQRLHGGQASFSLVHAAKHKVEFSREIWADWWVKQEKPRVRSTVAKYFRLAQKLPEDAEVTPVNLVQEILDGVLTKRTAELSDDRGIEVGVFVIKRGA